MTCRAGLCQRERFPYQDKRSVGTGHWAGWTVAASWVLRVSLSHSDLDIQVMSNRILALTDGAPSDSLRSGQTHSTPHSQCQSRTSPSNSQDE